MASASPPAPRCAPSAPTACSHHLGRLRARAPSVQPTHPRRYRASNNDPLLPACTRVHLSPLPPCRPPPQGLYESGGSCLSCDASCLTCDLSASNTLTRTLTLTLTLTLTRTLTLTLTLTRCDLSASNCTSCASTSYYHALTSTNAGSCVAQCANGTYASSGPSLALALALAPALALASHLNPTQVRACESCDASCATCGGGTAADCASCPVSGTPFKAATSPSP
eukprot:scaffold48053_cov31-Phaeocystis_antarctica.AAC.2